MFEILKADLSNPIHAEAFVELLNLYSLDPMGGGKGLSDFAKQNLASTLCDRPDFHVILAFAIGDDSQGQRCAGLTTCIEGFSTFACKPLLNVHDVMVKSEYRGMGLSKMLLQKAEELAIAKGCCKLTLEVLEGNHAARAAYSSFGFESFELDPKMGKAQFWQKSLS
jgi:ribosomal protein S18 acetylase RimI-like enzyme